MISVVFAGQGSSTARLYPHRLAPHLPGVPRGRACPPPPRPPPPVPPPPPPPARERGPRPPYLYERPLWTDPYVDVHAPPARGLREADPAQFVQYRAQLAGDRGRVGEVGARLGIQVDAQLVGTVHIGL